MALPEVPNDCNGEALETLKDEYDLSAEKAMAVELLANDYSYVDTADILSVHFNSVRRWKNQDESFKMALKEREEQIVSEFSSTLQKLNRKALDNLEKAAEMAEEEAEHATDWEQLMEVSERVTKILGSHGNLMEEYQEDTGTDVQSLVDELSRYFSSLSNVELKGVMAMVEQTDEETLRELGEEEKLESGDFEGTEDLAVEDE